MHALYHPALNGGKASDWLRPTPCQREGNKLPKGVYQSGDGYLTGVHLSEHLACIPSSRRESSRVSSQGKEAALVTHDTLPQVIKASALYYNQKSLFQAPHSSLCKSRSRSARLPTPIQTELTSLLQRGNRLVEASRSDFPLNSLSMAIRPQRAVSRRGSHPPKCRRGQRPMRPRLAL